MLLEALLWSLFLTPFASGLLATLMPSARAALATMCVGVVASSALAGMAISNVFPGRVIFAAGKWIFFDPLSAYNLAVMELIFLLCSGYAWIYFKDEIASGGMSARQGRTFAGLWCGTLGAMTLVLTSNNVGMMWVGLEATTLLTAFLICTHKSKASLEATWKYILICSVGIAFAFMGTILVVISVRHLHLDPQSRLLWTVLKENGALLDPSIAKAAFIFLLVGYGAKAGLAPMHNWLPDAHSQAPAPVSAVFSGFLLNAALYCLLRYVPIVEAATGGEGWCTRLLVGFGLLSILAAAAFIPFQTDMKRLLAYCSIEHVGIIILGVGLGGVGVFAALFHTLNHSLAKTLSFFAAGRLGQRFGSHEFSKMSGAASVSPLWGTSAFVSFLALIGLVPFSIFMSKFQIIKAAADNASWTAMGLMLLGIVIIFIGMLGRALPLAWGQPEKPSQPEKSTLMEWILAAVPLTLLLALGLWMPEHLRQMLEAAAAVLAPHIPPARVFLSGGAP